MSIDRNVGFNPMRRSPTPEYPLLALLLERPMHGYELHRVFSQDLGGIWHLSQSQLYASLARLEARGWVKGHEEAAERGLPRRVFALTAQGRGAAEEWLYQPSRCSVQIIRLELPTRLYLLKRLAPQAIPDFLARQRTEIVRGLERLRAQCQDIPDHQPYNRMACSLRIHQVESLLAWFDQTFSDIGGSL
ncbi:PadR family transcriptional regulator [Thermanaerothrix sp. 4228-RoL]|uniref:PadR family transcriptional regulator n=1 Tax=Thermanaerothrix solaris TaxID=3058434 RepID=A0ABU3NQE5_9CHLR|nr:PadR family transcriptional regulator [Thermanaerothrix sp. 4228-RoL]MDT8899053.1 PadR family transcriptional regulator [Thermanaerothrix sp. 4228-RoL]